MRYTTPRSRTTILPHDIPHKPRPQDLPHTIKYKFPDHTRHFAGGDDPLSLVHFYTCDLSPGLDNSTGNSTDTRQILDSKSTG